MSQRKEYFVHSQQEYEPGFYPVCSRVTEM